MKINSNMLNCNPNKVRVNNYKEDLETISLDSLKSGKITVTKRDANYNFKRNLEKSLKEGNF